MKIFLIFATSVAFLSDIVVGRSSRIVARDHPTKSSHNWSGAVLTAPPVGQTFSTAIGTFIAPRVSGSGSVVVWVGIDGLSNKGLLQAGIFVDINSDEPPTYFAWTEWVPDLLSPVENFIISAGDSIRIKIEAMTPTMGTATIENLSTSQTIRIPLKAPSSEAALKGISAEWIVEDPEYTNKTLLPLADFDTVTFTETSASTSQQPEQSINLTNATAFLLVQESEGRILTDVTFHGSSSVSIRHT